MSEYTDRIEVLQGHLLEIYEALDTAYGYHQATDLAAGYRNVGGTTRASNLTKRIEKAILHVEGYLQEDTDERLSTEQQF